ncbi:MAG: hypothetical protein IJ265_12235 [Oscillospiraceae bacterium]|nr:hypothetical protein [Oscillospiraceae bacterium]
MKGDTENHLTMNSVSSKSHDDIKRMFEMLQKDEKMRNDAISYALENKKRFEDKWGAAFIGRVTLMLKQADSEPDFENRIKSVKSTSKRALAEKFRKDAENKWESDPQYKTWEKKREYLLIILMLAKYFLKERKGGTAE